MEAQENQRNCRMGLCFLLCRGYDDLCDHFVLHLRVCSRLLGVVVATLLIPVVFLELYTIVSTPSSAMHCYELGVSVSGSGGW